MKVNCLPADLSFSQTLRAGHYTSQELALQFGKRGLTQKQSALVCGVSHRTFCAWVSGESRPSFLEELGLVALLLDSSLLQSRADGALRFVSQPWEDDLRAGIQSCLEKLASLRESVSVMNPVKQGTTWHTDRLGEIARLEQSLADLEGGL